MEKIIEKKYCTGCHACYAVCSKKAITMTEDSEGFLYPIIDESRCVKCGACKHICPILKEYKGNPGPKAYACINKNDGVRRESSSGGVFSLLANSVIKQNGIVFGAAFDEEFLVSHESAEDENSLGKMRGSKYVQSKISDAYTEVEKNLEAGRTVLFTGTPCQVGGLKAYLGKEYNNLVTQDIICHGVPSPTVWKKYVKHREEKASSKVEKVSFRNKSTGWKTFSVEFKFENGEHYQRLFSEDAFMQGFLSNLCLRPSCYNCHFKSKERVSDITLADFWGIEKECADMYDNKGTSLVLVNSEKGKKLFEKIEDELILKEVEVNPALEHNSAAYESVSRPKKREKFMEKVTANNFERVARKYSGRTFFYRCKNKFKTICKIVLKKYRLVCQRRK